MKKMIFVFLGILACANVMASENDFRCLKSLNANNPIRLRFDFPDQDEKIGYVTYQKGSERIQVKNTNTKETRKASDGRSSEFEAEWVETIANSEGGKYLIRNQAARIYDFKYIRKKDGKVFRFVEDFEALVENGCRWQLQKSSNDL